MSRLGCQASSVFLIWCGDRIITNGHKAFTLVLFSLPSIVSLCGRRLFFMLNDMYDCAWRRVCISHLVVRL